MAASRLRVVILKPSKYAEDGFVERFRRGFMPNGTLPHLASMTPARVGDVACAVHAVDEYVPTDLEYLSLLGVYPARGCPYSCSFCSVIKIAGRQVRAQPVETTLATLRAARAAGVRLVFFTSDNFNKVPGVEALLEAMIAERLRLPFFVQC